MTTVLTDTLRFRDLDGGRVASGRYVWQGPANVPVFALENCRDALIENVDVVCETQCAAVFRLERTSTAPGTIPNTNHLFRNVRIFGNKLASRGVEVGGIDENNEHMHFDHCSVYGCTDAAFTFAGTQSKENLLTHVRIESCDVGVDAWSGFQWIGGAFAAGRIGVHLMRVGEPVTIQGVGFEACGRLLVTSGPTTAAQPITLVNCRYESDQLHADNECIVLRHAGPLTIIGGRYGGGRQPIPRIALRGISEQRVTFSGDPVFGAFGAFAETPVVASNPRLAWVHGSYLAATRENESPNTVSFASCTVGTV